MFMKYGGVAARVAAYIVCQAAMVLLCIVWDDRHDWIKIYIVLTAQLASFEMLVSRRTLQSQYSYVLITLPTISYFFLNFTIWLHPIEPTPVAEQTIVDFNTSAIGDCHLTRGSQYCFQEGLNGWFTGYSSDVEITDHNLDNGLAALDLIRAASPDSLGISDENLEECKLSFVDVVCGGYHSMCDFSCKPMKMCSNMCDTVSQTCGDLGDLFDQYTPVLVSLSKSIGLTEEQAEIMVQLIHQSLNGCNGSFFTETDELCMSSGALYTTNITGISPEGACTPENAILYEQYLESLDQESYDGYILALDQYHQAIHDIRIEKFIFVFCAMIVVNIIETITYMILKFKERFYYVAYMAEFNFLSPLCRIRNCFISCIAGFLCYILRSIVVELELHGIYLIVTLLCVMVSGFVGTLALFLQDRIASIYLLERKTSVEKMKKLHRFNPRRLYLTYVEWYKKYFSSTGKYEYAKYIASEVVEVSLQINVMFSLAKTEDVNTVLSNIVIISVNLLATPLLLLHPSPAIWRTLNRVVDSVLDSAYLLLLYTTLTSQTNRVSGAGSDVVFGILLPAMRLSLRLYSLSYSSIRDFTRTTSPLEQSEYVPRSSIMERGPSRIDKRIRGLIIILFLSCGSILLTSTLYRVISKRIQCQEDIGTKAWHAIENHVMFPDGITQEISCNFENVKLLNLSNSDMTEVSTSLTKLVNLEVLDLSNNDLRTIPYELSQLGHLTSIDVSGNPVSTNLDWSGLGILKYPHVFLSMIPTLEKVDLRNNSISVIQDSSEAPLEDLKYLDLSMNSLSMISADYISSFTSLISLNLSHNELVSVDDSIWSMLTLGHLDLTDNLLTELSWVWASRQDGFVAKVKNNPVKNLDWSRSLTNRAIFGLPEELSDLSDLETLTASGQQIVNLGGLSSLKNLKLLNLSFMIVMPYAELCDIQSQAFLDFSYVFDPRAFYDFVCLDGSFIPNSWNISGFSMDFFGHPNTSATKWTRVENLVANDLVNGSYSNISAVLSSLVQLRTLSMRNSPITGFDGATIPGNLTLFDLRNTSMSLDYIEASLPDFNCTSPIPFVCQR